MIDIMGAIASMVGMGQRPAPRIGDPVPGADLGPAPVRARSGPRLLTHGLENMPIAPFVVSEEETRRAESNPHASWRRNLPMGVGAHESDREHTPTPAERATLDRDRDGYRELAWQGRHMPVYRDAATTSPHPMGPGGVSSPSAIDQASRATNVSPEFMNALIGHESGGRSDAKNPMSTATGHGQFIESTWLRLMREHGPEYGLPPDMPRDDVLRLRNNEHWSALMVGVYTNENIRDMEARVGRPIKPGEAYLGHFLGAEVAGRMLRAADDGWGGRPASRIVSREAMEANRQVFFNGRRERTIQEVIDLQGRNFTRVPALRRGARR